jgi:hypothetical protein
VSPSIREAVRRVDHSENAYSTPPKRCGRRAPDRYFARVFVNGAVVTVNVPHCSLCVDREDGPRDPYNTPAGIRTAVEAIHLRR